MTRNLKALGLALVAALAMSAVVAQAASAHDFTAPESNPTAVTAHGTNHVFSIWGGSTSCETATFAGDAAGAAADKITVHPKYTGCTTKLGESTVNVTVDTTGCNYILGTDTDVNGDAPVEIECSGTNKIKITAPLGCTINVGAQTPEGGVGYTNGTSEGKEDVTVNATVTGIHYTANFACQLAGLTATDTDGTYEGAVTAKGYSYTSKTEPEAGEGPVYSGEELVNVKVD